MFSIYDRTVAFFDNGIDEIEYPYIEDLDDYDDYLIITSTISIPGMKRGWTGDIIFRLSGLNAKDASSSEDKYEVVKDVLCSNCKFEQKGGEPIRWQYKFLKY